ncbi:MAG: aminopeptidase P family protein [Leptolyngbya sp.]|nr:aminopeptidase P family protein [Candidatus Melainabacteria bacterium]
MNNRLKKLQQALTKHNVDALIVRVNEGDNQNVLYLSGFGGTTGVLVVAKKSAFIVADARYYQRAEKEAKDFKLVKVQRGKKTTDHINEALALAKLSKASRIGFESAHISVQVADIWKKELNGKLVATSHLVERFRQFKDEHEVVLLRKACRITSKVYNEVAAIMKAGMTETEVAFELDMRLRKYGAVANSFASIVASGPNSAIPHHNTGDRKLKAGEPVIMDFGGLFPEGYCSDITRTAFVPGKAPSARIQEVYNVVLKANVAARKALKPGVTYRQFDKIARDYIDNAGYGKYFTHGLGHSLGLVAHDPYDYEHDAFDVGTVVTDEPGIYIDGFGGVRIEDDLVVTADGNERLTNAPYWKF